MTTKDIQDVVAERVDSFGDIWVKELEGDATASGCPKFVRINRQLKAYLTQLVKEVEEGSYQRGYEQGKFDGTMDTLHPTHAMHEPNLHAKHTGDNLTPPTRDVTEK